MIEWLKLPEIRDIKDLDDPATTLLHAGIIKKKPFLRNLYIEFYSQFKEFVPDFENKVLVKLGSGGLTLCQLVLSFTYPLVKAVEYLLSPLNNWLGMFQTIELKKVG
jgi:hypothetical protein